MLVRLQESFVNEQDQNYLSNLFSNRDKTRGGNIESIVYDSDELKALITYTYADTATRVLGRGHICVHGYTFTVTRPDQTDLDMLDKNNDVSSDHNNNNSRNKFYLVSRVYQTENDREKLTKFAMILAKSKPTQVTLDDASLGRWLVEFPDSKTFGKSKT